jgi:hypothetical protein
MDKKMKKFAVASLAGVSALAIGSAAHAAIQYSVVITPAASTGFNNDAYDLVSFYLTGLTGVDTGAGTLGSGGALLGLQADVSDSTPNGLFVPGSNASSGTGSWTNYITNSGESAALSVGSGTTDSSFINLDTDLTPAYDGNGSATITGSGTKAKVTAISGNATNFNASWGAVTGAAINPGTVGGTANNLIASIYALPGTTVSINGAYTTYGTNGGPLSLTSGGNVTPPTTHPIISLTSGSTPVTGYGPADGTLAVTTAGPGDYTPTPATGFTTATTGSVAVTQFNGTDSEVYALKLDSNGTPLTPSQIQTVIGDINGTNGTNASTGVVASTITGIYATDFPGYSVLVTANPGVTNPAEFGFDFSSTGEQDATVPGITVVGVAAVPEPATAASVVLGAAGLLLGRRRNKAVVA